MFPVGITILALGGVCHGDIFITTWNFSHWGGCIGNWWVSIYPRRLRIIDFSPFFVLLFPEMPKLSLVSSVGYCSNLKSYCTIENLASDILATALLTFMKATSSCFWRAIWMKEVSAKLLFLDIFIVVKSDYRLCHSCWLQMDRAMGGFGRCNPWEFEC